MILGPERKSRVISQKEKEITAYHEGGHALVAAAVKDADPVQKVSIISRGFAGGYTMKLPTEDQHLKTRNQFLADLAMMMGGYASEKLTFGDVSTGASNDLKEASSLARRLVMKYGMSELGPVTFGKVRGAYFPRPRDHFRKGLFRKGRRGNRRGGPRLSLSRLQDGGKDI